MAFVYPSAIDTPGGTVAQGGSLLTAPDHSQDHRTLGSAVIGIETFLGTNSASNGVFSGYTAGQVPVPINTGTLGTTIAKGTINNSVIGTQSATGGTFSSPTFSGQGTNSGTMSGGVYGTAQFISGTIGGSPTVMGTIIAGTNIADGSVIERKMKMDILGGTVLTSGSLTTVTTLAGIVGGSVTINLPIAMNAMIYFSCLTIPQGTPTLVFSLIVDGTPDTTWGKNDAVWNNTTNAFTAWRTGYASGNHTWQIQWRLNAAGTVSIDGFELIVIPYSQ